MATTTLSSEVQLSAQGRLVIPAELRRALQLHTGDRLIARQVGESIVLERREAVERRLLGRFACLPKKIDLVDEFLTERRAEARREDTK